MRGEKVKHVLTSRFRTAKIYQHRFTYFKVIARQTTDIFETQCSSEPGRCSSVSMTNSKGWTF